MITLFSVSAAGRSKFEAEPHGHAHAHSLSLSLSLSFSVTPQGVASLSLSLSLPNAWIDGIDHYCLDPACDHILAVTEALSAASMHRSLPGRHRKTQAKHPWYRPKLDCPPFKYWAPKGLKTNPCDQFAWPVCLAWHSLQWERGSWLVLYIPASP